MDKPKLAILVFASGKVNIVGAKERDEVYKAIEKMYPILLKYKLEFSKKAEMKIDNKIEKEFNDIQSED